MLSVRQIRLKLVHRSPWCYLWLIIRLQSANTNVKVHSRNLWQTEYARSILMWCKLFERRRETQESQPMYLKDLNVDFSSQFKRSDKRVNISLNVIHADSYASQITTEAKILKSPGRRPVRTSSNHATMVYTSDAIFIGSLANLSANNAFLKTFPARNLICE